MKHYSLFVSIVLTLMLLSIGGICYAQNMSNMSDKSEMSDTTKIHNLDEVVVTTNTKTKQSRATAPLQILKGEALEGFNNITYKNALIASQDIGSTLGAVVIDKLPAESISGADADLECFELNAEPESYVLYFNKEATELVAQVNVILAQMIADGTIDQYTINHSSGNN